jgi:hypothetical protein
MSMMQQNTSAGGWLIWMLFGFMALVSIACIATGGAACGYAIQTWAEHDYLFSGWGMIDWLVGLLGAGLVGVGLLIAGFFFRFINWDRAPIASLGLSIVSTACILGVYTIFSQTNNSSDSVDMLILQAGSILSLLIVALPPFLHWFTTRQTPAPSPDDKGVVK